ncbi:MAG: hypothetical protein ACM3WS_08240 [Bacillota bacterium]
MKHLAASLALAGLLAGCAYEPAEWYGIHASVPAQQVTNNKDAAVPMALPVARAGKQAR